MGVYSHEGRLEIALMRRQPRPSEPAREVHGEVPFWELAHGKSCSVLDLYGDSGDRMNAVHEVHGGPFTLPEPHPVWQSPGQSFPDP